MISRQKLRETVRDLIFRHNLSYEEFGSSIGVSQMMVSYVLAGKRSLGMKKVQKLCEVWGVELDSLMERERKEMVTLAEAINDLLRIKQIRDDDLSETTGIDLLTLNHIRRGIKIPSDAEVEALAAVLEVEKDAIDKCTVTSALRIIKEQMENVFFPEETVQTVMRYLEREIQHRLYVG